MWLGTETHLQPADSGWSLANNIHVYVVENRFAQRNLIKCYANRTMMHSEEICLSDKTLDCRPQILRV